MNPICKQCNTELAKGQHLSDLGTCPKCVADWIREYKSWHDRRFGKRSKAVSQ